MTGLNVLLIDNFDSFTFNLVDELRRRGATVEVWRSDLQAKEALERLSAMPRPRMLMLSPGPGSPEQAGCCLELIVLALGKVPIFGVCLGLQAIVQALGGEVASAGEVVHGKSVWIEHDGSGIFTDVPSPMLTGRYHSLIAKTVPQELKVTARYGELVMAVAHREHPLAGVQFHPESILTPLGGLLLEQSIRWAATWEEQQQEASCA